MAILSIETSSKVCSVAVHDQSVLLANYTLFTEKASSAMLTPQIRQILANLNILPNELEAIAVSMGPGSYTGLRIAVSTAKGLCLALEIPLIAINTLQALVMQIRDYYPENTLFCPMIDARRLEVYFAIYDKNLNIIVPTAAKIIDETSFSELLAQNTVVFLGDGAAKCKQFIGNNANALFLKQEVLPSASTIGSIAYNYFCENKFEKLLTFEPFYLKDFVGTMPKKNRVI